MVDAIIAVFFCIITLIIFATPLLIVGGFLLLTYKMWKDCNDEDKEDKK